MHAANEGYVACCLRISSSTSSSTAAGLTQFASSQKSRQGTKSLRERGVGLTAQGSVSMCLTQREVREEPSHTLGLWPNLDADQFGLSMFTSVHQVHSADCQMVALRSWVSCKLRWLRASASIVCLRLRLRPTILLEFVVCLARIRVPLPNFFNDLVRAAADRQPAFVTLFVSFRLGTSAYGGKPDLVE